MQGWEIEMVEKMPKEEQKRYYDRVIKKYKEQVQELKREKKSHNKHALGALTWRTGLTVATLAVIAGPAMMAFGQGTPVGFAGELVSVGAIGLFGGSLFGSIIADDDGPKDIKIGFEAARDAKAQIKELKTKIKNVEKKATATTR